MQIQKENQQKLMKEIGSDVDTIEKAELSSDELQTELYNKNQMYFENIDSLYQYFLFGQVEDIKQKVEFYVHENIDQSILDCSVVPGSIKENDNIISFSLIMEKVKSFSVEVKKDSDNKIIDITILHDL
ncbi:MAG: hypothetical protein N4A54_03945 [Peptostreptococcaceae bacterium]|jgi:hypothetical protein|nr:hypothetical protein [Peptostreptococcaceae bacterium]